MQAHKETQLSVSSLEAISVLFSRKLLGCSYFSKICSPIPNFDWDFRSSLSLRRKQHLRELAYLWQSGEWQWMKRIVFADLLNESGKFPLCLELSQGFKQFLKCSFRSRLPRSQSPCVSWGHCQYPPPTSIFWGWIVSCLFMLSHESLKLKFVCSSASHSYMFSFIVHFCYRILSQGCWTVWGCKYAETKISNSVSLWSFLSHSWVLWCLPRYEQQVKLFPGPETFIEL